MTTVYPGAIDAFTVKVDGVDDVMAADVNNPQDSIVAIETELGTDPAGGTYATLKDRLLAQIGDPGYGDICPNNDVLGLWQRLVRKGKIPIETWKAGADEIAWTGWAAYTGHTTPDTLTYANSYFGAAHVAGTTKAFRYRPAILAETNITARVATTGQTYAGIQVDDGVNNADGNGANNFFRVFMNGGAALGTIVQFTTQIRVGGGAVTTTNFFQVFMPGDYAVLELLYGNGARWGNWGGLARFYGETGISTAFHNLLGAAWSWQPVRIGKFFQNLNAGATRSGHWDWWDEVAV